MEKSISVDVYSFFEKNQYVSFAFEDIFRAFQNKYVLYRVRQTVDNLRKRGKIKSFKRGRIAYYSCVSELYRVVTFYCNCSQRLHSTEKPLSTNRLRARCKKHKQWPAKYLIKCNRCYTPMKLGAEGAKVQNCPECMRAMNVGRTKQHRADEIKKKREKSGADKTEYKWSLNEVVDLDAIVTREFEKKFNCILPVLRG